MGLFSNLFGSNNDDNLEQEASEQYDEYVKESQPTSDLSDLTKANIEAAYSAGLISLEQAKTAVYYKAKGENEE